MFSLFKWIDEKLDPAKSARKRFVSSDQSKPSDLKSKLAPRIQELTRQTSLAPKQNVILEPEIENPEEKTIDEWWKVLENESSDHSEHPKAFEEVLKKVNDLDGFVRLYDAIGPKSPSLRTLMSKLETLQSRSDDWADAYENRSDLDDFSNFLLKRAISMAQSPSDWLGLWEKAENSHTKDLGEVREALNKIEWGKDQWEKFHDEADGDSEPEILATCRLVGFCQSLIGIVEFYKEYKDNWNESTEADEAIFKAMFAKATRQEVQLISALAGDYDELATAANYFLKS